MSATESIRPRRRARRLRRVAIIVVTVLAVLSAGAYAGAALMKVPAPPDLYRLSTTPPSEWGNYFSSRTIEAGTPRALQSAPQSVPQEVPWKGSTVPFEEFLSLTHTNSFVVLRNGELAYEWYGDGFDAATAQSSFSMAKSMISLLIGQAIDRGELAEDDLLVDLLPDFKTGTEYDQITVRHLLDMAAGIDVSETYNEYWPFTGTSRMFLTRDLVDFLKDHRVVDRTPGTAGDYRSVETQVLGLILERVTNQHLADLLSDGIWKPVGAERSATWSLDHEDGLEKSFCCINATARDYARVGQLVLDDGRVDDVQVLPRAWVQRISTPAEHRVSDVPWGYSAQWWHPTGGNTGVLSMLGIYGQYVYVDPETHTVIVKLSDHGTEQDEQDTFDVLHAVSTGLHGGVP